MSRPLQRGSRRVSDGNDPSDWQTRDNDEKEGAPQKRCHSLGSSIEVASLFKFWNGRSSIHTIDERNTLSSNPGNENGVRSEAKDFPLQSSRLQSQPNLVLRLLKLGLILIMLLAFCGSFWWTITMSRASVSAPNIYRGYRRLQEQVREDFSDIGVLSLGIARFREIEFCTPEFEDSVPCFNSTAAGMSVEEAPADGRGRNCGHNPRQNCLVLPPKDYRVPLRWPSGKDVIWSMNVKISPEEVASSGGLTKRMMMLEDNQISFHSEAVFVDQIEDYSHQLAGMLGLQSEDDFVNAGVRNVLDIGCGYGSFGAHLFSKQLLTMCVANYEISGSQVQLTLERGLPAMIGSIALKQLPYPFLSFDMVHCARCGVEWNQRGGTFLLEADRVLKPGGYFVWTSPVTNTHRISRNKENFKKWKYIRNFTENLCWELLAQQAEIAVWKKTSRKDCYTSRNPGTRPTICTKGHDIEFPYYRPLVSCIGGTQSPRWIPIEAHRSWPSRAKPNATELSLHGLHKEDLHEDDISWSAVVRNYWTLLSPLIFSDHPKRPGDEDPSPPFNMVRNVMDMNSRFGGFNAALLESGKSVWVMNVVPRENPNYLSLIFDRGFVGLLHDWCEAFPTYPRTYDMLHADGLFSLQNVIQHRCTIFDIFLEMDRILRPEGWVILRDKSSNIEMARSFATNMKWDARMVEIETNNEEKLLICQKPLIKKQAY